MGSANGSVLASAPMSIPDATLPPRLRKRLDRWLLRWGTPSLVKSLRIEFSPRLVRAFGRCYQERRLIRLTPSLLDSQSHLLAEILCHEAAHAAVYLRHGEAAKPHGEEWEALMRTVGFQPRVRIPVAVRPAGRPKGEHPLYLHRCPVCERSRRASRPMRAWRCRDCVGTRSGGRLVIRREAAGKNTRRRAVKTAPAGRRRAAALGGKAVVAVKRRTTSRARQTLRR